MVVMGMGTGTRMGMGKAVHFGMSGLQGVGYSSPELCRSLQSVKKFINQSFGFMRDCSVRFIHRFDAPKLATHDAVNFLDRLQAGIHSIPNHGGDGDGDGDGDGEMVMVMVKVRVRVMVMVMVMVMV